MARQVGADWKATQIITLSSHGEQEIISEYTDQKNWVEVEDCKKRKFSVKS